MPVDSKHPEYRLASPLWMKCRDAYDGEEAIKEKGMAYLPMLDGQESGEYEAYKARAMFYGATGRTVQGLSGMVVRKQPEIEAPAKVQELLKTFGYDGEAFLPFAQQVINEVLALGRVGLLVDMPAGLAVGSVATPYCVMYRAENIINWRVSKINGERRLALVVLLEPTEEAAGDTYEVAIKTRYRVLKLVTGDGGKNEYQQEVWEKRVVGSGNAAREEWMLIESIIPQRAGGKRLDFIPFTFINPSTTSERVERSPLLPLVNVNLSHYRTSADLEHGRHFTALPTAWVVGFSDKSVFRIGSSVAWVSEDSTAKAGFLEFTGAGLGHLSSAMKDKENLMAILGARLLEEQKRDAEAAAAIRLRQAGEKSALASIAAQASEAFSKALQWFEWFVGGNIDPKTKVLFNQDYDVSTIDPQLLVALLSAVQSGSMSWDSYFYNAKRGELYPEGRTAEEELELIGTNPLLKAGTVLKEEDGGGETQGEEEELDDSSDDAE